ncbi:VOC family protein (plasmid) [Pseudosulfitobacter pseudonitzschiae]|nr:VOC family protein [Pseudosulfitobacter pseudonitzschiae]
MFNGGPTQLSHLDPNAIRTLFSRAMSALYRDEVPAYGTLLDLVRQVNDATLQSNPAVHARLEKLGELDRISEERHGAIRLGTAQELATMRRLFAVMGMYPVGYYDLSMAGVPVHSTAFRPLDDAALNANPFRVFTSLLRLDLIEDAKLREEAQEVLAAREIFTPGCLEKIKLAETQGGLTAQEAEVFVAEALETFRWHPEANVSYPLYERLHAAHRLVADVVAFKGPHINHLTPRTLDIDAVQRLMPEQGIAPKAVIEGPPSRAVPILLRQTSFKALEEPVSYSDGTTTIAGSHTARFGEIEQRGIALTPKGQALYDKLLSQTRDIVRPAADGSNAAEYMEMLARVFEEFPDDVDTLRTQGLGYFRYSATGKASSDADLTLSPSELVAKGLLHADPIVYEDFLPVSAAGIFQSNLGDDAAHAFVANPNRDRFEADLGAPVVELHQRYAEAEAASIARARSVLGRAHA